jgi:hypothetical protein
VCLALIDPAEDNGEVHIDPDDDAIEILLGEAAAVEATQHTDGTQQTQSWGDPVADQLATMSASFATLVAMFQETRGEVAELKAQLAASKEPVVRPKTFINPSTPTKVSVPTPPPLPPIPAVAQSHVTHPDSASFVPTIANLRPDGHLRANSWCQISPEVCQVMVIL